MAAKQQIQSQAYLTALGNLGYSFRLNELNDSVEVGGFPLTDAMAAKLRCEMRDAGFTHMEAMQDTYLAEAYRNRYNPIAAYLNARQYEGSNCIAELAARFTDKDGVFGLWLRKWLIGTCAKVFEGGFNPMLLMDGGQGLGKSHFAKWLASPLPKYFVESPIEPDNKDHKVMLISKWIWEVMEVGATLRKQDQDALKGFISLREATVRPAYGHNNITKPAMASFIGTVNNAAGLFTDPTGNRRFLTCKIESIDWSYQDEIDVHQVWAEAMAAYLGGENWCLSGDEIKAAGTINEQYEVDDPVEGMFLKYFVADPGDKTAWTSTADILQILETNGLHGTSRQNAMALAGTATKLGLSKKKWFNKNGQRVWGYIGVTAI